MKPVAPWLEFLNEEDTAFLKRFVLMSGSLKALAETYGVTYPTIRLRLDRLIQKIEIVEGGQAEDTYELRLRALLADGKLDAATFKELLTAYRNRKSQP